jgi:hypothetical protein
LGNEEITELVTGDSKHEGLMAVRDQCGVVMTTLVHPYKSSLTYVGNSHGHMSGTEQTNMFISNQCLVMADEFWVMADRFELMANQNSADHS